MDSGPMNFTRKKRRLSLPLTFAPPPPPPNPLPPLRHLRAERSCESPWTAGFLSRQWSGKRSKCKIIDHVHFHTDLSGPAIAPLAKSRGPSGGQLFSSAVNEWRKKIIQTFILYHSKQVGVQPACPSMLEAINSTKSHVRASAFKL